MTVSRREVAGLLAFAMTASTVIIPAYGALARFLIAEYGISRVQLGWLVTSVAGVAALVAPQVGRLTDTLGGPTMVLIVYLGSTVLFLAVAGAPTFELLLLANLLAALLNAAGNPAGNKMIVALIRSGSRGVIMGVKQSGVQIGVFLAGAILPGLALRFGWRTAIATMAIPSAAGGVWAWRIKRRLNVPRKEPLSAMADLEFKAYRHPVGVRKLAIYAFAMGAGVASQATFLSLYGQERIGLSVTEAGFAIAVVGLTGIVSRIMWSHLSEKLGSFASPLRMLAVLSVLSVAAILLADYYGSWLLWVGAFVSGFSVVAWNAVANLGAVALVDDTHAGHASGFVVLGFLGGFAVAPPLFGYSVEVTGSYSLGWIGVLLSFAFSGLLMHLWDREERRAAN